MAKKEKKITKVVYPKSFGSKKYPEFIRKSIFLKAFPKPKKAFPKIGLKNCEAALSGIKLTGDALYMSQLSSFCDAISEIAPTKKTKIDDEFNDFSMDCEELGAQLDEDNYDGDRDE